MCVPKMEGIGAAVGEICCSGQLGKVLSTHKTTLEWTVLSLEYARVILYSVANLEWTVLSLEYARVKTSPTPSKQL